MHACVWVLTYISSVVSQSVSHRVDGWMDGVNRDTVDMSVCQSSWYLSMSDAVKDWVTVVVVRFVLRSIHRSHHPHSLSPTQPVEYSLDPCIHPHPHHYPLSIIAHPSMVEVPSSVYYSMLRLRPVSSRWWTVRVRHCSVPTSRRINTVDYTQVTSSPLLL